MEPESLTDKLDREREELRLQRLRGDGHIRQVVSRQIEAQTVQVVRQARREEPVQRFQELRGHAAPAGRSRAPESVSGTPMEFYAWQEGVVGKITLQVINPFTAT